MQDEKKEFEDEQMQQDNHAEFFSLIAAYRDHRYIFFLKMLLRAKKIANFNSSKW